MDVASRMAAIHGGENNNGAISSIMAISMAAAHQLNISKMVINVNGGS
jgi:hypothetical protein